MAELRQSAGPILQLFRPVGAPPNHLSFWETVAISAFVLGLIWIALYAWGPDAGAWGRFALLSMVGGASWMAGALLGFLFGVPRFNDDDGAKKAVQAATDALDQTTSARPTPAGDSSVSHYQPNTNLVQISDWLTKIIVGATLVQLGPIVGLVEGFSQWVGGQIHEPTAAGFTGAILVYFAAAGFMWGYLWCSIRIYSAMVSMIVQTFPGQAPPDPDAAAPAATTSMRG